MIVGGTGSGKTTLANAVLDVITTSDPAARQVIIEDPAELQSLAENKMEMEVSPGARMQKLVKTCMRLSPDRIIIGEVRDGSAHDLIDARNTGHPGGLTTVHADSTMAAMLRIENLCLQNENVREVNRVELARSLNFLIFIAKTADGRKVKEIRRCTGYENGKYTFSDPIEWERREQ